jgi:hypothetical protein
MQIRKASNYMMGSTFGRFFSITAIALTLALIVGLPSASPAQTVTTLYNFTGKNSVAFPYWVAPAQGRDGRLYITSQGEPGTYGSILVIGTDGKSRLIHTFDSIHGATPLGGVAFPLTADSTGQPRRGEEATMVFYFA